MNIPMSWIKAYTNVTASTEDFVEDMTMSGSKVEAVEKIGAEITNVVTGKVLEIVKHPDADKLVITQIDIGKEKPIQIVTGATNLIVGAIVPVALDGATLPKGIKIKKGKLRGEESNGMLCSIDELGFDKIAYPEAPEDGIYIFQTEEKLGQDVCPILQLTDDVVEYEITSNRPDCFSVLGIAREVSATYDLPINYPTFDLKQTGTGDAKSMIGVTIENKELCPRYISRVVKNIKLAPSPLWLRHRLLMCGIRPINNIVDITNYVMLEYGQPLHAFDIDNIKGSKIIVRNAVEGEKFTTLDGEERILDANTLVISDTEKAVAIAGIMGGENSKVTDGASAILFESANFNGVNIRKTSKKLGLRTDASTKYEKGIDPNLAYVAMERAMNLVEELGAGEVVSGMVDAYPVKRESWTVNFSSDGINKLLGINLSMEEMEKLLLRVEIISKGGVATIPTFRPDIQNQADIAEEIARLFGYNNIPTTLVSGTPTVGKKTSYQNFEDKVKSILISSGVSEVLSYAFESPKVFDKLSISENSKLRETVKIINPLGEDFSIMRTQSVNSILQILSTNYNKRNESASLFEMAKVYIPKSLPLAELPEEKPVLTIGMFGNVDYFNLKGVIETLETRLNVKSKIEITPITENDDLPFLHPGRSAIMTINGEYLGFIGEVHPIVTNNYSIGKKSYVSVLELNVLFKNTTTEVKYKQIPKFPATKRDIAMVVLDNVLVSDIEKAIKERAGKILESATLFDVYKGENLDKGTKSVAFSLSFRASDKTLTDEEVNSSMSKILKNLKEKLDAQLRDK